MPVGEGDVGVVAAPASPSAVPYSKTWRAYKAVTDQLIRLRGELAEIELRELEAKVKSYAMSQDSSTSGKQLEAKIPALNYSTEAIVLRADISAKEDFRTLLQDAIHHGVDII